MIKVFITEKIKIESTSDSNATYTSIDGKDSTESGIQNSIINDVRVITFVANPDPGENQHYILALSDASTLNIDATKYNITAMGV